MLNLHNIRHYSFNKLLLITLFILTALIIATPANSTELRGKIIGSHSYSTRAFSTKGIKVELYAFKGQWVKVDETYSDREGFYYMSNIPPGNYYLQINGNTNVRLTVQNIQYQDIRPIQIQF